VLTISDYDATLFPTGSVEDDVPVVSVVPAALLSEFRTDLLYNIS
jgi:hypothetical protein